MRSIAPERVVLLGILLGFCGTACTSGDGLPESKLARGTNEHLLAGIDIFHTSVEQAVRKLGEPTSVHETSAETSDAVGEKSYAWDKPGVMIEARTIFSDDPLFKRKRREAFSVVLVKGTDRVTGRTGRGLELGAPYNFDISNIWKSIC